MSLTLSPTNLTSGNDDDGDFLDDDDDAVEWTVGWERRHYPYRPPHNHLRHHYQCHLLPSPQSRLTEKAQIRCSF